MPAGWRPLRTWLEEATLEPGDIDCYRKRERYSSGDWSGLRLRYPVVHQRVVARIAAFCTEAAARRLRLRDRMTGAAIDLLPEAYGRVKINPVLSELHYVRPGMELHAVVVVNEAFALLTLADLEALPEREARVEILLSVLQLIPGRRTCDAAFRTAGAAYGSRLDARPGLLRTVAPSEERRTWTALNRRLCSDQ